MAELRFAHPPYDLELEARVIAAIVKAHHGDLAPSVPLLKSPARVSLLTLGRAVCPQNTGLAP